VTTQIAKVFPLPSWLDECIEHTARHARLLFSPPQDLPPIKFHLPLIPEILDFFEPEVPEVISTAPWWTWLPEDLQESGTLDRPGTLL